MIDNYTKFDKLYVDAGGAILFTKKIELLKYRIPVRINEILFILKRGWKRCVLPKAWFPLNVSMLATNRSCLLVRTFLCFAGFHRQQSLGLLKGLLFLEVCKSRSPSGIEPEVTTFQKSLLDLLFWALPYFFAKQKIFLFPALLVSTGHSHSTSRHRSRKSSTCATLLRARRLLLRRLGLIVSIGVHISRDIEKRCASC